ncbi:MAG: dTMP kinase [Coriobacteriia bacterium]|nr:dTMP kinase [Coriobacteriia bacterium]
MDDVQVYNLPLSAEDATSLKAGQRILLSGSCYTLRDASIKRLADESNDEILHLRTRLKDQLIFFAGPTPAHPGAPSAPFGSVGPTTAERMDTAQIKMMDELSGGMRLSLGKGKRSKAYEQAARKHSAVYFTAVGGAAALLAQHVVASEIIAWPELGTEAIQRLELEKFPVTVAIDSSGNSVFELSHESCCRGLQPSASSDYPGALITFEGGEGAGKSTQIHRLESALIAAGHNVMTLREPGSSSISESIRDILLSTKNSNLSDRAELLLYVAARAQLIEEVIKPALQAGMVVLCDRFFDSTTAYQGYARGLDISVINALNLFATEGIVPDLTFILDVSPDVGLARAARTGSPDRLESENLDFHGKVREGFLAIARSEPDRVHVLDATGDAGIISEGIAAQVQKALQANPKK